MPSEKSKLPQEGPSGSQTFPFPLGRLLLVQEATVPLGKDRDARLKQDVVPPLYGGQQLNEKVGKVEQ